MRSSRLGGIARRDLLRLGFGSLALGASGNFERSPFWSQAAAKTTNEGRILVVVELSGGNDGLNTVVPYGDDAYYRARPRIGIKKERLRKLDQIGTRAASWSLWSFTAATTGSTRSCPMVMTPTTAHGRASASRRNGCASSIRSERGPHPGRCGALRRQRRAQHGRALW